VANDAVIEQRLHRIELLVRRHLRIDAMKLPKLVLLDAETLQAALGVGDQFFGAAVLAP